ncbi:MAG: NUDIX domain-containing protein [Patescibacteria group bacterium]
MSEILSTFLLNDVERSIPMARDEFYSDQVKVFKETGKPSKACEVVNVFIFNSNGELLVQKRSYDKKHNPGMLDKSVGGHVAYGDSPDYAVMVETIQELQTPSIVLKGSNDFEKTLVLLGDYLTTISVVKHSRSKIYELEKVINDEKIIIANKVHAYFGIYDGSIKPVDREAKGVLFYTLPELIKEMNQFPDIFTNDMHVLLKDLMLDIEDFLKRVIK